MQSSNFSHSFRAQAIGLVGWLLVTFVAGALGAIASVDAAALRFGRGFFSFGTWVLGRLLVCYCFFCLLWQLFFLFGRSVEWLLY